MEDLRTLRVTYRFMLHVCRTTQVGRHIAVEWVSNDIAWHNTNEYQTLLHRVAKVGNLEACFISGMHLVFRGPMFTAPGPVLDENLKRAITGSHKVAANVAAVLLYMANGGVDVDDTARQYMRQVAMGMKEIVGIF
jgi:hypothetical protein